MRRVKAKSRRVVFLAGLFSTALFVVASCAPAGTGEPPQATDVTVFEGARLIVGDGSEPIEDAAFIVENDQFAQVGRRGELDVPAGAARVDLTGMTVMPAIVDAHKHVSGERAMLVDQLEHLAYYGVGVAMSLGQDVSDVPFQVRDQPVPGAARVLTAGRGITAPEPGRSEAPYWVMTEEEARMAVQEQAARGVDMIKIWVDDRDGQYEKLSPALYRAVIDEAHMHDIRVAAHIFTLEDAKGLLRAGIDAFAHGIRDMDVDEEVMQLLGERPNFFLIPNLPDRGVAVDLGWLSGTVPADQLAELQARSTDRPEAQETFGIQARNLARMNEAGVRIAFGTDGSTPWAPHLEMEDMVAAGMTPAEVIVAATRNSADLLRLADAGTVEAGKSADFIVLEANPLDDITNTRRIADVYLRGAPVDRQALSARWTSQTSE